MIHIYTYNKNDYVDLLMLLEKANYYWADGKPPTFYTGYFTSNAKSLRLEINVSDKTIWYTGFYQEHKPDYSFEIDYDMLMKSVEKQLELGIGDTPPANQTTLEEFLKLSNAVVVLNTPLLFVKFIHLLTKEQTDLLSQYMEYLDYTIYGPKSCVTSDLRLIPFNNKYEIVTIKG